MPVLAAQPRQPSISFDEPTLSDRLRHRDAPCHNHHLAIDDEDESSGVESVPAMSGEKLQNVVGEL